MSNQPDRAVLVVDDNAALAENLGEILEDLGLRVTIAANGNQAIEQLANNSFDLVITDIRMPGMDGIAMLKTINQRWPTLPVVVMTAYSADSVLQEAFTEGALGVIEKPVDIEQLIGLVQRVTETNAPVLVVEDDRDLRVALCEALLEVVHVLPHPAPNVAAARRLAAAIDFRIAIIDIRLPDGDGSELGHQLQDGNPDLQVVYITGYNHEHADLEQLLRSPQMRLLRKPFSPQALLDLVRRAV